MACDDVGLGFLLFGGVTCKIHSGAYHSDVAQLAGQMLQAVPGRVLHPQGPLQLSLHLGAPLLLHLDARLQLGLQLLLAAGSGRPLLLGGPPRGCPNAQLSLSLLSPHQRGLPRVLEVFQLLLQAPFLLFQLQQDHLVLSLERLQLREGVALSQEAPDHSLRARTRQPRLESGSGGSER